MECKVRCVNFRSESDPRRAFRPIFRVTELSVDWYRSTMGVIVICLGTPRCTGENFGSTWEHLGALATCLGAPATSLGAPRITGEQSGKNNFGNAAGTPGNGSYYLSFNHC